MASITERLATSRTEVIDLLLVLAVTGLAVSGLGSAFDGKTYLVVALSAAVLGVAVSWIAAKLEVTWFSAVAILLVVFVVAGQGLATRGKSLGGVVPTPEALRGLVDGVVNGWTRLLTSLPRSGSEDNVLAVPYLIGFVTGLSSAALALRSKRLPLCVIPAFVALSVVVMLGTDKPSSILLQGVILAVVSLGWASWRQQRSLPTIHEQLRHRLVRAAVLLGVAGALGGLAGPFLPFAQAQSRFTLRQHVVPPFDLKNQPSPLAGFRKWQLKDHKNEVQATLDGWPSGQRLALAVMDSYDGLVYNLAGTRPGSSAVYERVGTTLPGVPDHPLTTIRVTPGDLMRPYVPTLGTVRSIRPEGKDRDTLISGLRVSRQTNTAIQTDPSAPVTTTYTEQVMLPPSSTSEAVKKASFAAVTLPNSYSPDPQLKTLLDGVIAGASSNYDKVVAVQKYLQDKGYFSDGGPNTAIAPGHTIYRIGQVLQRPESNPGNGEQFAAAMAYALNVENVPARAVIGFAPKGSGDHVQVLGSDVTAWVEVDFDQIGWVAFDPVPPKRPLPKKLQTVDKKQALRPQVPPLVRPHAAAADSQNQKEEKLSKKDKAAVRRSLPLIVRILLRVVEAGLVPGLLLSPALVIAFLKHRRRQRRRTTGSAAQQIIAGWQELLDTAHDVGHDLPRKATRLELVRALAVPGAHQLAEQADRASFAAEEPRPEEASAFWTGVQSLREALHAPLTRRQRWRAAISVRSLRGAV